MRNMGGFCGCILYPALGGRPSPALPRRILRGFTIASARPPQRRQSLPRPFDTVWNWAAGKGEIAGVTPTKGLERNPERNRERYLTGDELRRLGKALRDAETYWLPWIVDETGPKAKHLPKHRARG